MKGFIVKDITNKSHPVYGQKGLFATKKWNKYDILEEYKGELCAYRNSDYMAGFNLEGYLGYGVDAKNNGNETRYINHFENITKNPNCKFVSALIDNKPKIFMVVVDDIYINDEIVSDYCYNNFNYNN